MTRSGRDVPAPDRDDEQSSWVKSGTMCAVGLLALLIVCGGIVAVGQLRKPGGTGDAPVPPAAIAASAGAPVPVQDTGSTDSPAPVDVTWLRVGYGGLPFSAAAGPSAVTAGVPSGFQQSSNGAVIASMQILGRLSWSAQTRSAMRAVAEASTTPAAKAVESITYDPPGDPSVVPAVAGFQVVAYSPDQAVVNIALRFNGTLRVVPATMQWAGQDWKLAGAPGPLSQTNWALISDLTGYVLFSGQPTRAGE